MPQKSGAPVSLVEDHLSLTARQKSASTSYCDSCGRCLHQTRITCASCVNTGQFGSSKQRHSFSNAVHNGDQQLTMNTFTDRTLLLKQLNQGKQFYRSQITQSLDSFTAVQQMSSEIELKKARLPLVRHSVSKLREEVERKRLLNATIRERIEQHVAQIAFIQRGCIRCEQAVLLSQAKLQQQRATLLEKLNNINLLRQQRIQALSQHIFRLEHVSMIESATAVRNHALASAQREIDDDNQSESDDSLSGQCDRYQIIESSLLGNGDYEIDKLLSMVNLGEDETFDPESPEASLCRELCQTISGLSHATQLINALAFYFQVHLPFTLHHRCFNNGPYKVDELKKNIARLNTNIVAVCLSQDVPIDHHHFAHTLANLHKLVTSPCHLHRSVPVEYSKKYRALIAEQTMDKNEAYIFAPQLNEEDEEIDPQNLDEWESLPYDIDIPEDLLTDERMSSLPHDVADTPAESSGVMAYLNNRSTMAAQTDVLKNNLHAQLDRLLEQLTDLDQTKDDMEANEYKEARQDTVDQLEDFSKSLEKMKSGDGGLSLIDEVHRIQNAIKCAISQAFQTPEVIRFFAKKQPVQLRNRLAEIERDTKVGKLNAAEGSRQKKEILDALRKLGETLTGEEEIYLKQYSESGNANFAKMKDSSDVNVTALSAVAAKQIENARAPR